MKFNWGTGVTIFLIAFLLACAGFIYFAFQQDVNLVHKDYYEKGVDYSEQMEVNERSKPFYQSIQTGISGNFFQIGFDSMLAASIDSGMVLMYRPSNSKNDVILPLEIENNSFQISKNNLIPGRYILKLTWYSDGAQYQVDKPVNIQ